MSRSNILSEEGLAQANKSLKTKNWNLQKLVEVTTISRATISKFFNRKPVNRSIFEDVCDVLGLNYEDVIEVKVEEQIQQDIIINHLVSLARENIREYVQYKCGTIRVLDMEQPLSIDEIYVRVNVFKRILGRVWLTEDMIRNKFYSEIDRFNSRFFEVREERVEGLKVAEDYSKLIILGKPGSGKTTFLKHLALQCMEKKFQLDLIPFFVSLKDYSDNKHKPDLLEYLIQ
jgi:predicted NACHT family NTPase